MFPKHFGKVWRHSGAAMAQLVEELCYKPEGRGFDSRWCHIDIILPAELWPWGWFSSNWNEYQEYFLGVKGGRCVGLKTFHFHVPIVLKSGSLNLLEPSGPVQACTGIVLPFSRGEISYLAPLGSENISAPYFKQCFFRGGWGGITPQTVKHHASQSQDRNNKYFILYLNFASIIKFKM